MLNVVVMAGGRGSRMGGVEKPLIELCGKKIIEHMVSVAKSFSDNVFIAVSPHTRETRRWCVENKFDHIMTSGKGYPQDIDEVLSRIKKPILFLPADTPFITESLISDFLIRSQKINKSIITLVVDRKCFPPEIRFSRTTPIGISLFKNNGVDWTNIIMCRFPELFDIDFPQDLEYARRLCR